MGIGDFKHRIILQRLVTNVNENGFETESWEGYKTIWASIINLSGKEYFQAAAVQKEKTVKFRFRYIAGLNETMRIIFCNKYYYITSTDNIKYENKYIEVKALEVEENG